MSKSDYIPNNDAGKADLFVQFRDNITPYLATLDLQAGGGPNADVAQQAEDATYFRAMVDLQQTMQSGSQSWTAWKNYERDGGSASVETPALPVFPGTFPDAVTPGILPRFRALVRRVKSHKNYTPAIGEALGIEGAEHTGPDMAAIQPLLTATLMGGAVVVGWGWQGFSTSLDMLEIEVDRGDGKGWVFLTYDTTPGYTDTFPLPAAPVKWKYRAIYRVGDQQVGQWSLETTLTVGG